MSTENLKQLKIKTSILKRLRKEYESYQKETKTIQTKIQLYEDTLNANQQDEQASIAIKKNKEFLAQSESVLSNVKQKLIEAFQGLVQFLVTVAQYRAKREKRREQLRVIKKIRLKTQFCKQKISCRICNDLFQVFYWLSNNQVSLIIYAQQQIMNNKIKQPHNRIEYCRNLNAKCKLTVFTVHNMIEKIGENEKSQTSCSQIFSNLIPSTVIHRVSTENQTAQRIQVPMIYNSSNKIENIFRQSSSKLRYENEISPQVEKAMKNAQKRTRYFKTIEGDRHSEFNKNFAHKIKYMKKRVKDPQSYSYQSFNLMNFGLNIRPIKNINLKQIKKQKIKMKNISLNYSNKNIFSFKNSSLSCQMEGESKQIISLQSLNQNNLIIKQISEPKQNKKIRIKSRLKNQYSSLQKKVGRMFNCLDIILNSFHVRLNQDPREIQQIPIQSTQCTNRTFYKNRKSRAKYSYYVGGGNNANLIRSILRKRSWWTEVDNITSAGFVWTQLRSEQFIQKMEIANQNWDSQIIYYQEDTQISQNLNALKATFKKSSSTTTDICPIKETSLGYIFHQKQSRNYGTVLEPQQASLRLQKIQRPSRLHNHYSQNFMFGNKNALYYNISSYYSFCQKNLANIVPLTFYLQKGNQKAFVQFQKAFNDPKYRGSIWIMKPAQNSNRGQGIEVTNSLNTIKNKVNVQKKLIVQYYIRNLMLYNSRKFDIRTYMMATTINGRIKMFWYEEGYIRTSSEIYDEDNLADSFIHLTNDAVQKNGENYGLYEIGNKLSYSQFQRYLQAKYQRDGWHINLLHQKMKQLTKDAAKAIYCRLNPKNKAFTFQLFGLDFMVDNQFKPYLIQINTNPCLQLSSPVLQRLIPRMMQNMFRLCVDPIFRPEFDFAATKSQSYYIYDQTFLQRNKFSLIYDEKFDRDFEWEQHCKKMRGLQWSRAQQQEFEDEGNFIVVQY